jgi:hypothetical protein
MFGAKQQIPHRKQNDEEADCHERVSTGKRPWLVGKARAGCSVGQPALMSSPYGATTMKTLATLAIATTMFAVASASAAPGFIVRYECKVTEAGSDKDPVSNAKVAIGLTLIDENHARPSFFVSATHTTASGVTYDVKDQYANFQTGKVVEWGMPYWQGKDKKNRAVTVFAGFETHDNEYVYKVVFSKDVGNGKFEKINEIESKCDMTF